MENKEQSLGYIYQISTTIFLSKVASRTMSRGYTWAKKQANYQGMFILRAKSVNRNVTSTAWKS